MLPGRFRQLATAIDPPVVIAVQQGVVTMGPVSCTGAGQKARCVQTDVPKVVDTGSLVDMIGTCYGMAKTDDDYVNQQACETFTAKIWKRDDFYDVNKKTYYDTTRPCKWISGDDPSKGVFPGFEFGHCAVNKDRAKNLAFPASFEG